MSATQNTFRPDRFITPKINSLSQIITNKPYKLKEQYNAIEEIEKAKDKLTSDKINKEIFEKHLVEKTINNLFGDLAESKTKANKNSVEYIKGYIEAQYFKEFKLTNPENYAKRFRFEGKAEPKRTKLASSRYLNEYLHNASHHMDRISLEKEMERKREIRYKWKRVLINAALQFKRMDIEINQV
jgi:hypothetical protein